MYKINSIAERIFFKTIRCVVLSYFEYSSKQILSLLICVRKCLLVTFYSDLLNKVKEY